MKKENNAIVITGIISAVVLIIAIIAFTTLAPVSKNVVTANGMSTIKAVPDLITVYFNIETKGSTSSEANTVNTEIFNKLSNNLVALGFNASDLKTDSFSIYPNIDWSSGTQKQNGYIASHSVKVEISTDKISKLNGMIDAGANAGAGISYINFELTTESQNKYKADALKLASEDARVKAESVAAGLGKRLGALVSVSVNDFGYVPWNVYTASGSSADAASAKASVMNIQPGEKDITGSVSATFRLI